MGDADQAAHASAAAAVAAAQQVGELSKGSAWRLRPTGITCGRPRRACDAHLVLSSGAREPIGFRVLLDGQAPGPSHGVDVDEDGNGVLADGRLYQPVRAHDAVRDRTLEITFWESGAEAYVFTFG